MRGFESGGALAQQHRDTFRNLQAQGVHRTVVAGGATACPHEAPLPAAQCLQVFPVFFFF